MPDPPATNTHIVHKLTTTHTRTIATHTPRTAPHLPTDHEHTNRHIQQPAIHNQLDDPQPSTTDPPTLLFFVGRTIGVPPAHPLQPPRAPPRHDSRRGPGGGNQPPPKPPLESHPPTPTATGFARVRRGGGYGGLRTHRGRLPRPGRLRGGGPYGPFLRPSTSAGGGRPACSGPLRRPSGAAPLSHAEPRHR